MQISHRHRGICRAATDLSRTALFDAVTTSHPETDQKDHLLYVFNLFFFMNIEEFSQVYH